MSSLAADMSDHELMGSPSRSDLSLSDLESDQLGFDSSLSDRLDGDAGVLAGRNMGKLTEIVCSDGYASEAGTIADPEQDEHALARGALLKRRRITGKQAYPVRELRVPGRNRFRASRLGISPRPATYIQVC